MASKIKADQFETLDGSGNITLNNSVTMASGKTLPAASLTGTLPAISGANLTGLSASDSTKLPLAGGTLTGNLDVTMTSVGDGIDLIDTHTAHGITDYLPTNASLRLTEQNDTEGGGRIVGATDNAGQHGLSLYGLCQDSAVATVNNIQFIGAEKSGTGIAAVANDKSVFKFFNNSTALLDIKGNGRAVSLFTAHAWGKISCQGTPSLIVGHNISSISDRSTGRYRANYTTNSSNANSVTASGQNNNHYDEIYYVDVDDSGTSRASFGCTRSSSSSSWFDTYKMTFVTFTT